MEEAARLLYRTALFAGEEQRDMGYAMPLEMLFYEEGTRRPRARRSLEHMVRAREKR